MNLILQQIANGLVLGGAYVLVALGLFMLFSTLHIPNFAHGEMYAIGAYLQYTFVVQLNLSFWVGLVLTVVGVGILGWILEILVFRRLGSSSVLAILVGSLALAIVLQELIQLIWGKDALAMPAPISGVADIGPVRIANYRILIIGAVIVTALAIAWLVYRSRFGRSLRAYAQNSEIARLAGLSVRFIGSATFIIGSAIAGLAGALLAPTLTLDPHMGFHPTLVAFVILVVAGAGGRMATVVAAGFLIAILETFVAGFINNSAREIVVFVALVIFLAFRPEGIRRLASTERARL